MASINSKVVKQWTAKTSTAMMSLCELTKEQLDTQFEKINANISGTEITSDMSLPNAKGLIHELGDNAHIIMDNTYALAGQTPPSLSTPQT